MGSTLTIIGILAVFPIFLIVQYASAQSSDCYTRFIFAWHTLNPVLDCMEERLDAGGSGNGTSIHTLLNSTSHSDTVTQTVSRGSLVYGNSTPLWDELVISSSGKYLRSDGTDLSWQYGKHTTIALTPYTATSNDELLRVNTTLGDITINLPTVIGLEGKTYEIININGVNDVIIDPAGIEQINGAGTTHTLTDLREGVIIKSDGVIGWNVISYFRTNLLDGTAFTDVVSSAVTAGDLIVGNDTPVWDDLPQGSNGQVLTVDTTGNPNLKWVTPIDTNECTSTGTGEAVCESANNINSLIAGTGITIADTTGDLTITNTVTDTDDLIGQLVVSVFQSVTKTNIGTSLVDVYATAFDMENMASIDCNLITDFRIVYMWDYVGTGTHSLEWVDVADNNNKLFQTTIVADADPIDSGWFSSPAWCSGIKSIELRASSTTAGDDPQSKGYVIYAR